MVDVDCRASCDTRIRATAQCTPGQATLRVDGAVSADLQTRAQRLGRTLGSHYGVIDVVAKQLETLRASGTVILTTADRVPAAVGTLGFSAGACAAATIASLRVAVPQVQVSVSASVMVSGAVSTQ